LDQILKMGCSKEKKDSEIRLDYKLSCLNFLVRLGYLFDPKNQDDTDPSKRVDFRNKNVIKLNKKRDFGTNKTKTL